MTQIFTGEGLGLRHSSLDLGAYGPKGTAALGQGGAFVYMNAANGNLLLRQSDGFLADVGFGLDLFQTYNAHGEGNPWQFNFQSRLEFKGERNKEGSSVTRIDEDGHRSRFVFNAQKQAYLPEEGGTARLTYSQNRWTYHEGSQKTSCYYNQDGRLDELRDLDGHSVTFNYQNNQLSSITGVNGKQKISWSFHNGLIQDITSSSEGVVTHKLHYEYDANNRLHKVTRDLGQGKTFWITYDYVGDSNRISDIKESDGAALHIEYDAQCRVKKLIDGEGRVSLYDYEQGKTTLTNGLDEVWTYYYDDKSRLTGVDGSEHYRIRYQYEGAVLSSVTEGQKIWHFSYNDEGDCTRIEEPSGQVTKRLYDAAHHVISETQYQSFDGTHHPIKPQTSRYIYDERGHLLFTLLADGTVTEHRYDEQGQLSSTRTYLHTGYDMSPLNEDAVLSQETLKAWISTQNPQDISLIDYHYDWRGQVIESLHYSTVDALGQGIGLSALSTRYRYDAAGRLIEKSVPIEGGWSMTQYLYDDLGRLIQSIDNQNHSQRFEYDDDHQRVIQTDANGLQSIRLYDKSGLLLCVMRQDNTHDYGTTRYTYDASGRLISETGVDGRTAYIFYDHQGRVQAKVSATGELTEFSYNDEGLICKTHQYKQHVSTNAWLENRPDYASVKPTPGAADRMTQIVYNQYQQIAYRIDAEGAVIAYEYNAQGQVIKACAYAKRLENYKPQNMLTYDSIRLISSDKDRSTYTYYDIQGRIAAQINAESYATAYTYDRLGNLIETTRYLTPCTNGHSGQWSQDKPSASPKDIHNYSLYDARGLKVADIDGEGYLTEYRYDNRGLLQERIAYEQALAKNTLITAATTLEQIRPQERNNDQHSSYQYNDLGLITQEKTQAGLISTYVYNEMGQLLSKTLTDEQTHASRQQRYRYDALGRVIQSLNELGCALVAQGSPSSEQIDLIWQAHSSTFEYDNSGLLIRKTNALKQSTQYFYDEQRTLRYTVDAEGTVKETEYNAFGELAFARSFSTFLKTTPKDLSTQELSARLEAIKNDRLDEFARYEYNSIGQLIATHRGSRGITTSTYNVFGELESRTEAIDAQSKTSTLFEYDKRGFLTQRIDDVGGLNRRHGIRYDAFGWVIEEIDGQSHQMKYLLNKRGEQVRVFNASNQMKLITYDAFGRVLSATSYRYSQTKELFSYDDKNKTMTVTAVGENTQVVTQFNAFGDKLSIKDAKGYVTDFHYNESGQLIRMDTPEEAFKEYRYDESGHLLWQQDAAGQIIEYHYDAAGHLLSQSIDPDGLNITSSYQYDGLGRQLKMTDANGCVKHFVYDNQGRLTQSCIDPDGINSITDFSYDDRGLLLRQTELNAHGLNKTTAYEWDHLGRRTATIIDPDGLKITTTYAYDASDNLICQTDANQHSTHYIYDVNNRCRYEINPRGVVTEHVYDINGYEIQTHRYASPISSLSHYDELSLKAVLKEDAAHDQYQFRDFDSLGRVQKAYDALGYATAYEYDGNGNLICVSKYAKPVSIEVLKKGGWPLLKNEGRRQQHFVYDSLNQLRFTYDHRGRISESLYDKAGQRISTTKYAEPFHVDNNQQYTLEDILQHLTLNSAADQTTRYTYDKAGRVTLELSPAGIAKSYEYDPLGNVIASSTYATRVSPEHFATFSPERLIKSSNDRVSHFVYDAAGREVYRVSSEGRVLERRYDALGNVIAELTHSTPLHLSLYNEQSIKKALFAADKEAKLISYEYDAAGRLLSQADAPLSKTQYTYDAQGNVLSKTQANQALWSYQYDEANQLVETKSPSTKVHSGLIEQERSIITRNSYDSFGNLISVIRDAEGLKQTQLYEFDNNNHKIKTIYPGVAVNASSLGASNQRQEITQTLIEECRYNAFAEVIASSDKSGNWKHFAYDDQGLLAYSLDTQGAITRYKYNGVGQVVSKISYANRLQVSEDFAYSMDAIALQLQESKYDRHEVYVYNLDNQLIEVSRDKVIMYNPKTSHHDAKIKPTTKTQYNAFGEVIKTSVQLNESEWAETYTYYDKDGHQTAVIDPEGYLTTFEYNVYGEVRCKTEYAKASKNWDDERYTSAPTSNKDRTVVYTYDALGQLKSKTLKQVSYQRLKPDNKAYETDIKDLTTTYSYDALGNLTATTDAKGNTAYCYYDALGQLIAKVAPKTSEGRGATTYAYDALGHLIETRRWAQGALEADEWHFALKGASNNDVITQEEYDASGQLMAQSDGLNHKVYYSYDANGNLARSWQILKQVDNTSFIQDKRYRYDSEGHLLQTGTFKHSGLMHTEDAQYNTFGELTAKGANGTYTTHVDYDKAGRIWRSNTQGYYQIFLYDLTSQVTQVVSASNRPSGLTREEGMDLSQDFFEGIMAFNDGAWNYDFQRQNNTYDKLGRLLSQNKEFSAFSPAKNLHLEYNNQSQTVDRWGNLLSHTNASGFETRYEYNAFNQLIKQELPEVRVVDEHGVGSTIKPVTHYAYDELGQSIAMTDANGHMVSKEYDALGRVILERDAKSNTRTKGYNLLDQLAYSKNELGGVTRYAYDKENRLIEIKTPKTQKHYEYDELGQLIKQTNGRDDSSSFWYDSLGNQIKRSDARGYETLYEYDAKGRKTKETDALGRTQSWVYNDAGRLTQHTDLGGHVRSYKYNLNGVLVEERSSTGVHIKYSYQGDGALVHYEDETLHEFADYTYDAGGQLSSKLSAKTGTSKEGWTIETDYFDYDSQGRLSQVRRRHPDDKHPGMPQKDHTLFSINYDYDAVGNIRHTQVSANYTGYEKTQSDDYYTYDENNRILMNKGRLEHGQILMHGAQSSRSFYDEAGNIKAAIKSNEFGQAQNYRYQYNNDNQLELITREEVALQAKSYDDAGRVTEERAFDTFGHLSQTNKMFYEKGLLKGQILSTATGEEVSNTIFDYDKVGNLSQIKTHTNRVSGRTPGTTLIHDYSYELWDGYQQSTDKARLVVDGSGESTTGTSTRAYDINGQLKSSIDAQSTNNTYYQNSGIDGIKGRQDKDGETHYLSIQGKTIGDVRLDKAGDQHLNVYGGFTPGGNQKQGESLTPWDGTGQFLNRTDNPDGQTPEAPQDNLGAYTLQAGDTLSDVAFKVYGDSSLWYLIADANGITDKNAQAGASDQVHIGQRITIPPVSIGQHHTSSTHKVLNPNQIIGTTTATLAPFPVPPPLPRKHGGLWAKIIVGVITVIATVMTSGILGALAGAVLEGGGGIFALGMAVLGGTATMSTGVALGVGFAAGFVGSIANQAVGSALGLQEGTSLKQALVSGLATAATAGLLRGLNLNTGYQGFVDKMDNLPVSKAFSISSAAQMLEQNALSQSISLAFQKHQHFEWEQLGIAGVTGGVMGSGMGRGVNKVLKTIDHNTGILSAELNSVATGGAQALATGAHFDAAQVLSDNLGSAVGHSVLDLGEGPQYPMPAAKEEGDSLYLTENVLDMIHPERTSDAVYQNYLASVVCGGGGYESLSDIDSQGLLRELEKPVFTDELYLSDAMQNIVHPELSLNALSQNYIKLHAHDDPLLFKSDLLKSSETTSFEKNLYWGEKEHGVGGFVNEFKSKVNLSALSLDKKNDVGKYDIDYDALVVKHRGFAYRKSKIVSYSYYYKTPGSPISGDASKELQIESIDELISSSIKHGLSSRETAHVLVIARHESGFNPYAAAGTTSASGLGQFVIKTGARYGLDNSSRWDIKTQANALVEHFIENKEQAHLNGKPESYIYKYHHDGKNSKDGGKGFKLSQEHIVPYIGKFHDLIHKVF